MRPSKSRVVWGAGPGAPTGPGSWASGGTGRLRGAGCPMVTWHAHWGTVGSKPLRTLCSVMCSGQAPPFQGGRPVRAREHGPLGTPGRGQPRVAPTQRLLVLWPTCVQAGVRDRGWHHQGPCPWSTPPPRVSPAAPRDSGKPPEAIWGPSGISAFRFPIKPPILFTGEFLACDGSQLPSEMDGQYLARRW